jgi:hypothetical protein
VIELPLNYIPRPSPKLTQAEISMIDSFPGYMSEQIFAGIPELDPRDDNDLLPAFFAYRMRKIPGKFHVV